MFDDLKEKLIQANEEKIIHKAALIVANHVINTVNFDMYSIKSEINKRVADLVHSQINTEVRNDKRIQDLVGNMSDEEKKDILKDSVARYCDNMISHNFGEFGMQQLVRIAVSEFINNKKSKG